MKYYLLCFAFSFMSCNHYFFVRKEKVIIEKIGFILFGTDEQSNMIYEFFIPTDGADTSKSIITDFLSRKKGVGFALAIQRKERGKLKDLLADSIYNDLYDTNHLRPLDERNKMLFGTFHILPVSIKYADLNYDEGIRDVKYSFLKNEINLKVLASKRIWLLEVFPIVNIAKQRKTWK